MYVSFPGVETKSFLLNINHRSMVYGFCLVISCLMWVQLISYLWLMSVKIELFFTYHILMMFQISRLITKCLAFVWMQLKASDILWGFSNIVLKHWMCQNIDAPKHLFCQKKKSHRNMDSTKVLILACFYHLEIFEIKSTINWE